MARNLIHNLNNIKWKCDNRNKKLRSFAELQLLVDSFSGKQSNHLPEKLYQISQQHDVQKCHNRSYCKKDCPAEPVIFKFTHDPA